MLFFTEKRYGKSLYEILNGSMGAVDKEFIKAEKEGYKRQEEIFTKLWIFIHGSACMSITGDYDLELVDTIKLLKNVYKELIM